MNICVGGYNARGESNDKNLVSSGVAEGHSHLLEHSRIVDGLEERSKDYSAFFHLLRSDLKIGYIMQLQEYIEKAWNDRDLLKSQETQSAIREVIALLDAGNLRVAERFGNEWTVNEWVKKAVILYFPIQPMETLEIGPFEFHDKIALKKNYKALGVRIVPGGAARYGSYLSKGVIMMPSFVNIGAYVDEGTMVDTWATAGSCAQIGKHVHLSGGGGIGGVVETVQAAPVIIYDNAFIGS